MTLFLEDEDAPSKSLRNVHQQTAVQKLFLLLLRNQNKLSRGVARFRKPEKPRLTRRLGRI